jgi:probable addiction module antidote protein
VGTSLKKEIFETTNPLVKASFYLEACLKEAGEDAHFIAKVLSNIAREKGMSQLARDTGLGRESLYKALSGEGKPNFHQFSNWIVFLYLVSKRSKTSSAEILAPLLSPASIAARIA